MLQPQDRQNALAALRKWRLERDDETDPNGRIYRDTEGNIYHSVTRILSATAPAPQKAALERWLERPTSEAERNIAAERGTLAHNHAEYVLKTARKMAIHTANKRGVWSAARCASCGRSARITGPGAFTCSACGTEGISDALERAPAAITHWAIQKAIQGAPRVPWSAAGYARGLRGWIEEHVTAIHSIEFAIHDPRGWAGTCDGLLDINGELTLCDWKTSANARSEEMLLNYKDQLGAYSLGLTSLTGMRVERGAIVVARRTGAPQVRMLDAAELAEAETRFISRAATYFSELAA